MTEEPSSLAQEADDGRSHPAAREDFLRARLEQRRKFYDSTLAIVSTHRNSAGHPGSDLETDLADNHRVDRGESPPEPVSARLRLNQTPEARPSSTEPAQVPSARPRDSVAQQATAEPVERPERTEGENPSDRRVSHRYPVSGVSVSVGWHPSSDRTSALSMSARTERGRGAQGTPATSGPSSARQPDDPRTAPRAPNLDLLVRQPGELVDISQAGLCILLNQPAPADRHLWIGFSHREELLWTEAVLRSLSASRSGGFLIRLSFVEGCPYEVFSAIVTRPGHGNRNGGLTQPRDAG